MASINFKLFVCLFIIIWLQRFLIFKPWTGFPINLAFGLALEGKKALIIDLHPQAHATICLGIDPAGYKIAIADVLPR